MKLFKTFLKLTALVIILMSVSVDSMKNDYSELCLKCFGDEAYPECGTNEKSSRFQLTIYCQILSKYRCAIRLAKSQVNSIDEVICKMKQSSSDLEELHQDDVRVVTLLKPWPILMRAEAAKTADEGDKRSDSMSFWSPVEQRPAADINRLAIVAKREAVDADEDGDEVSEDANKEGNGTELEEGDVNAADPEPPAEDAAAQAVDVTEVADAAAVVAGGEAADHVTEGGAEEIGDEEEDVTEAAGQDEAKNNDSATEMTTEVGQQTTNAVDYPDDEAFGANASSLMVVKCFACTSVNNSNNCTTEPELQIYCQPAQNASENGCYTLVEADLNTTSRGCISELAEAGMEYCHKDNSRFCTLCYADGCNDRLAAAHPRSSANALDMHAMLTLLPLAITSFKCF